MGTKEEIDIKPESIIFWIGLMAILAMAGVFGWHWKTLPPELPWLYSMPWGDTQLIPKVGLASMIGGLLIIYLINSQIARWVGNKDNISKTTVLAGGLVVVLIFLAGFIRVIEIFI